MNNLTSSVANASNVDPETCITSANYLVGDLQQYEYVQVSDQYAEQLISSWMTQILTKIKND